MGDGDYFKNTQIDHAGFHAVYDLDIGHIFPVPVGIICKDACNVKSTSIIQSLRWNTQCKDGSPGACFLKRRT